MGKLKLLVPIIAFAVMAYLMINRKAGQQSQFTNASFEGKIIAKEQRAPNTRTTRDEAFVIRVQGNDGQVHEWFTSEMDAGYYKLRDGAVKIAGKSAPAIFRDGRQIRMKGIDAYLDEEVSPPK